MSLNDDFIVLKRRIIETFTKTSNSKLLLEILKDSFKSGVNSPRRLEQITALTELIFVLERRLVLDKSHIAAFSTIARTINEPDLTISVQTYESKWIKNNKSDDCTNHKYISQDEQKLVLIIDELSQELGTSWKALARHLGLSEGQIDCLEEDTKNIKGKVEMIVRHIIEKCNSQKWINELCRALEKVRRKDLKIKVENIWLDT